MERKANILMSNIYNEIFILLSHKDKYIKGLFRSIQPINGSLQRILYSGCVYMFCSYLLNFSVDVMSVKVDSFLPTTDAFLVSE